MSNELLHSAKGSTWQKNDHKYVRKYKNSKGKWVYVYADKATHEKYMNTRRDERFLKENSITTKLKLPFLNLKNTLEKTKWKATTPKKTTLHKYTKMQKVAINNKNQMEKFSSSTPKKNPLVVSKAKRDKAAQRQKNTATYLKAKSSSAKKAKKYSTTQKRYYNTQIQNSRIEKNWEETKKKNVLKNRGNHVMHSSIPEGVVLREPYENELAHSKGPWADHKYVKKVQKNGKWRYVYSDNRSTGEKIVDAIVPIPIKTIVRSVKGINESAKALKEDRKKPKKTIKQVSYKTDSKGAYVASIQHSAKGTSWEKKDHKYISKIVRNGKTYYKYNPKTDTYQQATPEEMDTRPHNKQEQLKLATESTVIGLKQAQENMLTRRGLIDGSTLLNKSAIAGNKINSQVNGGQARRRTNK